MDVYIVLWLKNLIFVKIISRKHNFLLSKDHSIVYKWKKNHPLCLLSLFFLFQNIPISLIRFLLFSSIRKSDNFSKSNWKQPSMKMGTKTLLAYCASIHKCPYLSLIHKIDMNIDLGKIANFYNTILVRGKKLLLRDSIWQWLVSSTYYVLGIWFINHTA